MPGVSIDQEDGEWVLRRLHDNGDTTSIQLSAQNVLSIVEAAPFLQARVSATLPGAATAGARPVFAVGVKQIDVGGDFRGDVLLRLTLPNDLQLTYSLGPQVAEKFAQTVLQQLAEMRGAPQPRH